MPGGIVLLHPVEMRKILELLNNELPGTASELFHYKSSTTSKDTAVLKCMLIICSVLPDKIMNYENDDVSGFFGNDLNGELYH